MIRSDYNYFRYYDPSTGRYITSDPIGLAGGLNTYGYVYANPLGYIDPYGLSGGSLALTVANWAIRHPQLSLLAAGAGGQIGIGIVLTAWPNDNLAKNDDVCPGGNCTPNLSPLHKNENADDDSAADNTDEGKSCPANPPNIDDFDDPNNLPEGWDWRGKGKPGSREGAYHNPTTGESLHDDRTHPPGKDPHTTYTDPDGTRWDNYGDGWVKQ